MNPTARRTDVIVQEIGTETLVYDRVRDAAHSLNPVAAYVFAQADGTPSAAGIAAGISDAPGDADDLAVVEPALWRLEQVDLLGALASSASIGAPRELMVTRPGAVLRLGVTALALSSNASIIAPTMAMAASKVTSMSSMSSMSSISSMSSMLSMSSMSSKPTSKPKSSR